MDYASSGKGLNLTARADVQNVGLSVEGDGDGNNEDKG